MKNAAASIEHRLVKTSVATWICTIITMVIQLISVPICLHYWGKNTYGTWLAVYAAFTLLRTIDFGYTIYVGNRLNVLYHTDDEALRLTLASAVWGILALGLVQLILLIILYLCNSMSLIIGHTSGHNYNFDIFLALMIMSICWIFSASYIGVIHRILIPLGMLYQSTWMMMWLQVALFIALVSAAKLNLTILHTSILFAVTYIIFYTISAVYIKSLLPQYYPWWHNASVKVGITNIFQALPLTFSWIMTQSGLSALVILISAVTGPAAVPVFTAFRTISNLWTTLINSLTQPMIPEAVRFHARGQWQNLVSMNQVYWGLVSTLVNFSLLIIYPFLRIIFGIWTRHHLFFDKPLLNLLLAAIVVSGMSAFMNMFLSGINISGYIIASSIIRGIFVLLAGWILLPIYGTTGLGFAIFMAELLLLGLTVLWFSYQIINRLGGKISMLSWSWLSSLGVVVYLMSQCFWDYSNFTYCLALFVVIISTTCYWHALDINIKNRIKLLIRQVRS